MWRQQFEVLKATNDTTGDADPADHDLEQPGSINVRQILSEVSLMESSQVRTVYTRLSEEQKKERDKLEFSNRELDYTPNQWKERLDKYVALHKYLCRGVCYLAAIESFLTPVKQNYMKHVLFLLQSVSSGFAESTGFIQYSN